MITTLPKIGIRPTIDGRRKGIRESLEVQTMNMAKAAAELISSTLRYPNGKPVECIIADTTIGGVNEAAACAAKFAKENEHKPPDKHLEQQQEKGMGTDRRRNALL